jgi:hypothetical protein
LATSTGRKRIATLWCDRWYTGCQNLDRPEFQSFENRLFGNGLFGSLGFEETHFSQESEELPGKGFDVVFIFPTTKLFQGIKKAVAPARVIVWLADDDWRWNAFGRFWMHEADVIATCSQSAVERYYTAGFRNVHYTTWGCRDSWRYGYSEKKPQASFVGLFYGDRPKLVTDIGDDYSVDAHDWKTDMMKDEAYYRHMADRRYALCLTGSCRGPRQMKGRMFEPQISDTILVTEDAPGLSQFWKDREECFVFKTAGEAAAIMRELDRQPEFRNKVVEAARTRLLREHMMVHRVRDLMAFAEVDSAHTSLRTA